MGAAAISDMTEALTWSAPEPVLADNFRFYVDLVSDAFAALLAGLERESPETHTAIREALEAAPDDAFMRVLLAPETTYRLLWRREPLDERGRFVASAFRAEAARLGSAAAAGLDRELWTALGDVGFGAGGQRIDNPRLASPLVFDVLSPHAATVDLGGPSGTQPRQAFGPAALQTVVEKLDAAGPKA